MKKTDFLTSTQKGEVAENIINNQIIALSGGRINPFRPIADDGGIDILLYDKSKHRVLPCQVKARLVDEKRNWAHFMMRKNLLEKMKPLKGIYLIAAVVDWKLSKIEMSWFLSLEQFRRSARQSKIAHIMRPSKLIETQDKWMKYRCGTPQELVDRILDVLQRKE